MTFRRLLRYAGCVLIAAFVAAQFYRLPRTNPATPPSRSFEAHVAVPTDVSTILRRACTDCHSNRTRWPWYSSVAPFSWFVIDHVNHGRSHLNFSEWDQYDSQRAKVLGEMCEQMSKGAMPLPSYLVVHRGSRVTPDEIRTVCDWTKRQASRR